jgi:hypothetical protein
VEVLRQYLYPYGDPDRLDKIRNRIAFLVAEGVGSWDEIARWPVTRRERVIHHVIEKIKRKNKRTEQTLEGISKILGG